MTDMRNVNNWHWVNKDCRPWAKTYFTQQLIGLSVEKDNIKVQITSIDECTGDVDLNQRKGKLLAIYDMALKLGWQAQLRDGSKVFGSISVPEVAYDTELDEYVFNIQVNQNDHHDIKKLIRAELTPLLREKFSKFTQDLIQNYSTDLYADPSTTPDLVQRKKPITLPPIAKKNDEVTRTTTVKHSFDFNGTSARDIYEALLDSNRAAIWTQGKSKVSKKINSKFEFFDGNVHGVLLKTIPGKSITQTWRLKSWPKEHFSNVTLTFDENEDGVTVNVVQKGVPIGQEEIIKRNWMGYYWNAIKENQIQLQQIPIQSDPYNYSTLVAILVALLLIIFTAYLGFVDVDDL